MNYFSTILIIAGVIGFLIWLYLGLENFLSSLKGDDE
jgi:hypothetical protein